MSGESRSAEILGAHKILTELLCPVLSRNSLAATRPRSDFIYTKSSGRRGLSFRYTKNVVRRRLDFIYTRNAARRRFNFIYTEMAARRRFEFYLHRDWGAIRPKIAIFKLETWVCFGAKIFNKCNSSRTSTQSLLRLKPSSKTLPSLARPSWPQACRAQKV